MVFVQARSQIEEYDVVVELMMKDKHEFKIYSVLVLGILLFIGSFIVVWNATEDYRANINRPTSSQSETVKK